MYVNHVFFTKRLQSLVFFGFDYIYRQHYDDRNMARIHDNSARGLQKNVFFVTLTIIVSTLCFAIYPIYLMIFKKVRLITVPLLLPFTNPQENLFDFQMNCIHQLGICSLGFVANVGNDIISCFLLNNIDMAIRTICWDLHVYGELLNGQTAVYRWTLEMKEQLRKIWKKTQDMNK